MIYVSGYPSNLHRFPVLPFAQMLIISHENSGNSGVKHIEIFPALNYSKKPFPFHACGIAF